nr:MAG TPA: hypothetical protein [Caudoviricetes sp.]
MTIKKQYYKINVTKIKIDILKIVEFVLYIILLKIDPIPMFIEFLLKIIERIVNWLKSKEECNMKKSNNKGLSYIYIWEWCVEQTNGG